MNQLIKVAPFVWADFDKYSARNISIWPAAGYTDDDFGHVFGRGKVTLSLEFWSAWWREEEIIPEKGEKSIKVAPTLL